METQTPYITKNPEESDSSKGYLNTRVLSQRPLIRAYLGDCMDWMQATDDKEYDLAIVDPPYGINFAKTNTGKGWITRKNKDWDKEPMHFEYFAELRRVSKNQIIWGANYYPEHLQPSMGWIFWDKGQRNFSLADGEFAFSSFKRALRVYKYSRAKLNSDREGIHPTEKPVALYRWILQNYAKAGQRILDTHGGSFSSAVACHVEGYEMDICEIDEEYFEAGVKRFGEATCQLKMF